MKKQLLSLALVSKKEDRMKSGHLKGGATLTVRVEGIRKPKEVVGKPVTLRIFEVDKGGKDDRLAVYSGEIVEKSPKQFEFAGVAREWPEPETLPGPEPAVVLPALFPGDRDYFLPGFDEAGHPAQPLDHRPEFQPPHFHVGFEGGPTELVLIKGDAREREGYLYELGFELKVEERLAFRSVRTVLDCTNLLTHNLRAAMTMMREHHLEACRKRDVGTHYGVMWNADYETREVADRLGLKSIDCMSYVLEAGELGHRKTLAAEDWKGAMELYLKHEERKKRKGTGGGSGMHLAERLVRMGWLALYWSRDTVNPRDSESYHKDDWKQVKSTRRYRGVRVVDTVVNFEPSHSVTGKNAAGERFVRDIDRPTPEDRTNKYDLMKELPFGILILRNGMHTALYGTGEVYEVHWEEGPVTRFDESGEVEETEVPLFDKTSIDDYAWNSGLLIVPPGTWDKSRVRIGRSRA